MKYQHSEKDDPIIEFITTALNDHLGEWYGDQSGFTIMTPAILTYDNCFIMRFHLLGPSGVTKNILVKIRRHPKMRSLNQAAFKQDLHTKIPAEYNDLESLYKFFGNRNGSLGAVRPLIYLEKYFAIVIEKPLQPIAIEVQELIDRLRVASQQQNLVNSMQAEVTQKISSVQSRKISYSNIHGDMTCDNVLYSRENKVCIIDVKTKQAPIYSDIGLIMIHPDTFLLQKFSRPLFPQTKYPGVSCRNSQRLLWRSGIR